MKFNTIEFESPAQSKISFHKVYDKITEVAKKEGPQAEYAKKTLEIFQEYPVLLDGIDQSDDTAITDLKPQIDEISQWIFPNALTDNEIKCASAPYHLYPLYASNRYKKIIENAGEGFQIQFPEIDKDHFYIFNCISILAFYYHYPVNVSKPFVFEIPNAKQKLSRYYRVAFNADMIEMKPLKNALEITKSDYEELINAFDNIDLWKEKFPPNSWEMKGVSIANYMDVTIDHATSQLTSNLLVKDFSMLAKIKENIRTIFSMPQLEVGFIEFENNTLLQAPHAELMGITLSEQESIPLDEAFCSHTLELLINKNSPLVVSDVESFHQQQNSCLSSLLTTHKIKSAIIAPVVYNDELLGLLELSSPNKAELNTSSLAIVDELLPILSMAASGFKEDAKNRIEAIIQQECTTIHPSVKWKFEQEAIKYMKAQDANLDIDFEDIIFDDVYPLYGQADIKSSSSQRNNAVLKDLQLQLNNVRNIIASAFQDTDLPALEALLFQIDKYKLQMDKELFVGSEHSVRTFMNLEIYPVLDTLVISNPILRQEIINFKSQLDSDRGIIYDERKKFDESVSIVNQKLSAFLDHKQIEAQEMFPHYYERFKTDGIEYNMYIGQSMIQNQTFNPLYLKNLKIWQLLTMCQMEIEFAHIQKTLPMPLEIASLILVYSNPLAIHFRTDEKRFDVEGAYNARYEIIKKRVDKAFIKNTTERLTVPKKLAIIYSHDSDKTDYLQHISFLEMKGYIIPNQTEELELENLQGITGLKALRVSLNFNKSLNEENHDQLKELVNTIS